MSGHFDFTGDFPRWEDADENQYETNGRNPHQEPSFDELVDS